MASSVALVSTATRPGASTPMIHPRSAGGFIRAPGYDGPLPPGSPGDYSAYIPSGAPMLPPVSGVGGMPGILQPSNSFDVGGAIQGGIGAASQCPPHIPWWICAAAGAALGGEGNQGGSGSSTGSHSSGALTSEGTGTCPSGYERDPQTGQCKKTGFGGFVERALPGGSTGFLPSDNYGPAVMTALGPALTPRQTGTVIRSDGSTHPTLGCPAGMVLGRDSMCYDKRVLPRAARKWKPAPKPPMSASDAKALRRIGTLQRKVKKLAGNAGLSCRKR